MRQILEDVSGCQACSCDEYEITFPYEATSDVNRIIKTYELEIFGQLFEMACTFKILVRKTQLNQIIPIFEDIEGVRLVYRKTV